MHFTTILLYASVASLLLTSTPILAREPEDDASILPNRTLHLPSFMLQFLIVSSNTDTDEQQQEEEEIDLDEFRMHVHRATNKHLTIFMDQALGELYTDDTFKSVRLDSTLHQKRTSSYDADAYNNNDKNETDLLTSEIDVSFEGWLTVFDDGGPDPDGSTVQELLEEALSGNAYWKLVRRFVEDPVLVNVTHLNVVLTESTKTEKNAYTESSSSNNNNNDNSAAIWVLSVFSIVLAFAIGILSYLAYQRYKSSHDMCCSQSKVSDATDDDDDHDEEFDDENQDKTNTNNNNNNQGNNTTEPCSLPRKKKKRRTTKPTMERSTTTNNTAVENNCSLHSIQEEADYYCEDDGMSNIS